MVSKSHPKISLVQQCRTLGLCRSGLYTKLKGESALNIELMEHMDKHHLDHPYKGFPSMYVYLTKDLGYQVSRNRVSRLYYDVMCLRAMVPGPHTSKRNKNHPVYPYLLRDLKITKPNQVWACDITYIPIHQGYVYLLAFIDIHSRYVVGWDLSNTMSAEWCVSVFKEAVAENGKPDIINTDQGSQFTAQIFAEYVLQDLAIKLSMDGKGRATDNAFIERLWRSVKYEKIYLYKPEDAVEAYMLLSEYFDYYNHQRRHSSLDDHRPNEIYHNCLAWVTPFPHSNNSSNDNAQKVELLALD